MPPINHLEDAAIKLPRILLVDDHRMFLDGLQLVLERISEKVVSMISVREALASLEAGAQFDIILTDLHMPGLDGYSFIQALQERQIFTPVMIVSAADDAATISRAMAQGAQAYLPKSASAERIIEGIQRVMLGEVYIAPELPLELGAQVKNKTDEVFISPRQKAVLSLVANGYSNKDVSMTLNITEATVKSHLNSIFKILAVQNRTACVKRANELNIL